MYKEPVSSPLIPLTIRLSTSSAFPQRPPQSILDQACSICCSRKLCFRCLKPIVPPSHTRSINCPNTPVSPEQRLAFVDWVRQNPIVQILALQTETPMSQLDQPLTFRPLDQSAESLPAPPLPPSFPSPFEDVSLHSPDDLYKDTKEATAAIVPVSTVHVRLDVSKGCRILVPTMFKLAGGVMIPATILVDTGSMANFINKGFVQKHHLQTQQQKHPVRCVGFDGREGLGGLVTQDWAGVIQLSSINSQPVLLQASFGIT
ncbi:hypothetical protein PCANC_23122 [Puccinia coronata f. sp. avenae]|uniref:Uncharacterized protein n=1 Tax=Puccinia coronata f. sp. avenae TaxID=200324 RepID=A0A2N5U0I9_9BASI|nr:hypothetical protein PCANC_23122 [Puccinia coronata f. sp. avenae]